MQHQSGVCGIGSATCEHHPESEQLLPREEGDEAGGLHGRGEAVPCLGIALPVGEGGCMPQRAAMEAEVLLPPIDAEWYNNRFGTNLNKVNMSNWLNGTGETDYDPKELEPLKRRFRLLK